MVGVAAFAYEGIGLVLPSETAMRESHKFEKTLAVVLVAAAIAYCVFGAVPYAAFGQSTGFPHGQVTDNLEQFALHAEDQDHWHTLQHIVRLSCVAWECFVLRVSLWSSVC